MAKKKFSDEETQVENESPKKPSKLWAVVKGAGAALALWAGYASLYQVDQTQHAVLTTFGNPNKVIVNKDENTKINVDKLRQDYAQEGISLEEGAGLRLKWPWQSVNYMDKRILRWDGWPEELPTKDKKNIWIDTTARWYIDNPLLYFRKITTESKAQAKLSDIIDSMERDAIGANELTEIVRVDNRPMEVTEKELSESVMVGKIQKGREKLMKEITEKSREMVSQYGIEIHDVGVLVKGLAYVESVKESVEGRMRSERMRIAEKYTSEGNGEADRIMGQKEKEVKSIRSNGYKIAREIEGIADAEVTKIYAEGFRHQERDEKGNVVKEYFVAGLNSDPEFYSFLRAMGILESGFGGNGKASIVIGTDNPLMKYLKADYRPVKMPVKALSPTTQPESKR